MNATSVNQPRLAPDSVNSATSLDAISAELIRSMSFAPGARVLDASSGGGAAALAAAEAVGPFGCVLAVGRDEQEIAPARAEAVRQGLGNVSFQSSGVDDVGDQPETFDAVFCSFPNSVAPEVLIRRLWQWVRVDGELVVAIPEGVLDPAHTALTKAVARVRPTARDLTAWGEQVRHSAGFEKLLAIAAAAPTGVSVHARELAFSKVEEWWPAVLQPYYRGVLSELTTAEAAQVRELTLQHLTEMNWQRARLNVITATVWKRRSCSSAE